MLLTDSPQRSRFAALKQGSSAWLEARTGVVTCSRLNDILAVNKDGKPKQARLDYLTEKVVERITGDIADHYMTAAMQRGVDLEPVARTAYEARRGVKVAQVGIVPHPSIRYFAGSPDGLVGDDGMIEIKTCASREKYLRVVMSRDYAEWIDQIQGNLACNGREWCDLVVYDDRFIGQEMHIARIPRNQERIEQIERAVRAFLLELDEMTSLAEEALGGSVT